MVKVMIIKKYFKNLIFLLLFVLAILLFFEAGLRSYYFIKNRIRKPSFNFETYLGWQTKSNLHWKGLNQGYGEITYSTTRDGFRIFGNADTDRIKIFIIGDSITLAETVSDGKTYYDYLRKNNNNIEIFAYGGGGYGSLQEYMILDKYLDIIKPNIILWQFCGNDIHNNSFELESSSWENNNHMVRPYYRNGKIVWLFPHSSWLYRNIFRRSYLISLLCIKFNISLETFMSKNLGETPPELEDLNNPLRKRAIATTSEIMSLVKKKAGAIPIVAFAIGGEEIFKKICVENKILFAPNVYTAIEAAKKSGIRIDGLPYNPHPNDAGHAIMGRMILEYLIDKKLVNID